MKTAQVTINREKGQFETFIGAILNETTTFLFVQHGSLKDNGEWFARNSKQVEAKILGE